MGLLALRYISRYAATGGMLRRVLKKHIAKARRDDSSYAAADAEQWIEEMIVQYQARGWINDDVLARRVIEDGNKAGYSRRALTQKLLMKGIDRTTITEHMHDLIGDEDDENAALIFAQRKRLGPYRTIKTDDRILLNKDLAKLCRAGFSLDVARKIINR